MAFLTNGISMVGLMAVVTAQLSQQVVWENDQHSLYRVGEEFLVNQALDRDQRYPTVSFLLTEYNGEFVVAWETFKNTQGISARIFDNYGSWSSEYDVMSYTDGPGSVPSIASFDSGYVITWGGCLTWTGNDTHVYANVYYDFGTNPRRYVLVTNGSDPSQGQTCPVAVGSSSGFVVVWVNKTNTVYLDSMYAQHFNNSGYESKSTIGLYVDSFTYLNYPSATLDDSDGLFVTWGEQQSWGDYRSIEARYVDGRNISQVSSIYPNDALFSSVANLSTGGYAVVWQEYNSNSGTRRIWGTIFDRYFYPIYSTFTVNTYNYYERSNTSRFADGRDVCRVIGLNTGGFIVVWATDINEGTGYDVFGQVFSNEGSRIGDEFRINTYSSYDQFYPSISVSSTGLFVVVWQSLYQDSYGYGVYGQRFQFNVLDPSSGSSGTEVSATLAIVVLAIIGPIVVIAAYLFYLCRPIAPEAEAKM